MAVSALPRQRAGTHLVTASVPAVVLVAALMAPALDLLRLVQPLAFAPGLLPLASGLGGLALLAAFVRFPRTSWLGAAAFAAVAGAALRMAGADVAPILSLLAIVALGVGGAFASPVPAAESWIG